MTQTVDCPNLTFSDNQRSIADGKISRNVPRRSYIQYCEDISRPNKDELETTLIELTGAVLKEISLIEVSPDEADQQGLDDLPLCFAVRALILKVKIGIAQGSYGSADQETRNGETADPVMLSSRGSRARRG